MPAQQAAVAAGCRRKAHERLTVAAGCWLAGHWARAVGWRVAHLGGAVAAALAPWRVAGQGEGRGSCLNTPEEGSGQWAALAVVWAPRRVRAQLGALAAAQAPEPATEQVGAGCQVV